MVNKPLFGGKQAAPKAGGAKRAPGTAVAGGKKVAAAMPKGMVMKGHPKGHGNMSFGARMAALRAKKP